MRTQDLNHFESVARALARGATVKDEEIAHVLEATGRTREELDRRVGFHRGWAEQVERAEQAPPSELERYQEETKIMGAPEGLVIVVAPLVLMVVVGVILLFVVILAG